MRCMISSFLQRMRICDTDVLYIWSTFFLYKRQSNPYTGRFKRIKNPCTGYGVPDRYVGCYGGTPVAMSYGDVYTSLQTGIIDGTENNETALTTGKHGEICKVYSKDEHAMIPDVMVMSAKIWNTISPEDQQIILEAAQESTDSHKILWEEAINDAVEEAKNEMGVEFVEDVDKDAFREATKGMIEDYCERYPGVAELLDIIESVK